jgi:hypothetical protein
LIYPDKSAIKKQKILLKIVIKIIVIKFKQALKKSLNNFSDFYHI